MTDRLAELFAQDPSLVNAVHEPSGVPPLFWVPEDEEEDERVTAFLLAHGADPNFRNKEGLTAQELSRRARGEC
jgi:hypothetical protein